MNENEEKITDNTTFKRSSNFKCFNCDALVNIGKNYPGQPEASALEIYCPTCTVISFVSMSKKPIILNL